MSLVAAGRLPGIFPGRHGARGKLEGEEVPAFMEQQEIRILKKTKKNEKEVDIKPYYMRWRSGERVSS